MSKKGGKKNVSEVQEIGACLLILDGEFWRAQCKLCGWMSEKGSTDACLEMFNIHMTKEHAFDILNAFGLFG